MKPGFQVVAKGRRHFFLHIVYCTEYFGLMILFLYKQRTTDADQKNYPEKFNCKGVSFLTSNENEGGSKCSFAKSFE